MSWTPVTYFMPVTFVNEYGWPQSEELMVFLQSGRQTVARFERLGADEDFPHAPGQWRSCCSERWDLTDQVTDWRPLFEKPTGQMPGDPLPGHFVDDGQMTRLLAISKSLYGDGTAFTADSRRDLAHRLHSLISVIEDQAVVL